jgi:hypothetical protein
VPFPLPAFAGDIACPPSSGLEAGANTGTGCGANTATGRGANTGTGRGNGAAAAEKIVGSCTADPLLKGAAAVTDCYVMCALRTISGMPADNIKHVCGKYQAKPGKCRADLSECHIQG